MLKASFLATATFVGLAIAMPASAHNALGQKEGYAGYSTPMVLNVNHGCGASPVVGLRVKVPDGIIDAKAASDPNWTIEYKMRKLDKPVMMHGRPVSEVPDEIIWKDPVKSVPADGWYPFQFRITIPDTPGKVMHVKNITVCEEGTDPYIDMPSVELNVEDPEFAKKAWDFMTATKGPAPFLVIRAPAKKQNPWEWTPEQARNGSPSQEAMAK